MHTSGIPWLTFKAANGLCIPYVDYAVLDFSIRGIGLLGTNVVVDCWTEVFRGGIQESRHSKTLICAHVPQAAGLQDCLVLVEDLEDHGHEWRVARLLSWTRGGRGPPAHL